MHEELQRKDPRVVTERSERLHGFGMRILLANARSPSLSFGDYARNNQKKKDPRVATELIERQHGLEVQRERGFECDKIRISPRVLRPSVLHGLE